MSTADHSTRVKIQPGDRVRVLATVETPEGPPDKNGRQRFSVEMVYRFGVVTGLHRSDNGKSRCSVQFDDGTVATDIHPWNVERA